MQPSNSQNHSNTNNTKALPTLTVLESHQLLNYLLPREGTPIQLRKGIRNYAMTLIMLDAGLRVGEVCKLLKSDIVFTGQIVQSLVLRAEITKYKIERTVPLSSRVQMALKELLERVWDNACANGDSFAFYLHDPKFHITPRQVQRIIANASAKSIGHAIHPHVLRHTFATRLMKILDIRGVQTLLGHKQLSSTQIYTHPSSDDMKKAIDSIGEPAAV